MKPNNSAQDIREMRSPALVSQGLEALTMIGLAQRLLTFVPFGDLSRFLKSTCI